MFVGLAIVCDEYFVPSLELIADHWKLAPNVAGATLMAAGGSAPELFTAYVGTFQRSVVGLSTVVGSAVFNVLFVIGMCIMFQKKPLKLTAWPLARDCLFYTIALTTLTVFFAVVSPQVIEWWEAVVLLVEYAGYVCFMKHNDEIQAWVTSRKSIQPNNTKPSDHTPTIATFRLGVVKLLLDGNNFCEAINIRIVALFRGNVDETFDSIDTDKSGSLDRNEMSQALKKLHAGKNIEITEKQINDTFDMIDTDKNNLISRDEFTAWYIGSEERLLADAERIFKYISNDKNYIHVKDLGKVFAMLNPSADSAEHSTISKLAPVVNSIRQADDTLPPCSANTVTYDDVDLELAQTTDAVISYEEFLSWYKNSLLWKNNVARAQVEAEEVNGVDISYPSDVKGRLLWFMTIPLLIAFKYTIPDVRKRGGDKWKYAAFAVSICWIGIMSYWMVLWAENVGSYCNIPVNVMGLTVLAAGTSVPDLISSVIVMRQGEGDMAISSSIGSNIFDVLVGLPLPWLCFSIFYGESPEVHADNLTVSLPILIGMLISVVSAIHISGWVTHRVLGYIMFMLYAGFVAQDLIRSNWE